MDIRKFRVLIIITVLHQNKKNYVADLFFFFNFYAMKCVGNTRNVASVRSLLEF